MKSNSKAQITIFIILGLLIVGIVALLYYFVSAPKIEYGELDTTSIETYITSCLDKTAKQALVKLGEQGGYLFVQDMPESKRIGKINIAYLITAPQLISVWRYGYGPNPFPSDWRYPWKDFPYENGREIYTGYFGNDHMPSLEAGKISFKKQLEKFIEENITNCLDLNIFKEQGFKIKQDQPKVEVIIAKDDVIFNMMLLMTIKKGKSKKTISKFNVIENIKLRDLYNFLKTLIYEDITDIKFDITEKAPLYAVAKSEKNTYDLITIVDSSSAINARPYLFQFIRENRKPALHNDTNSCNPEPVLNKDYFDPDEDSLAYCTIQNNRLIIRDGAAEQDSVEIS